MAKRSGLFATTVSAAELDPVYRFVRDDAYAGHHRQYLEALWVEFEPFADRNFLDQFQRKGHHFARAWEMRLTVVLKRLGLAVTRRSTVGGPDILVEGTSRLWIEAVTPSPTAELQRSYEASRRSWGTVRRTSILLRYAQVLKDKWDKYTEYLAKGIVADKDHYIIAVSGSALLAPDLPGKYGEPPAVAHVLYAIGSHTWEIEVGTGRVLEVGRSPSPRLSKPSGAEVEADWFLSAKHAGISAVLYAPNGTQNRPEVFGRGEGWDFELLHNQFASTPVKTGLLGHGREWAIKDGRPQVLRDYRNWP